MQKDFTIVFIVGGIIAAVIIAMSTVFLIKGIRRAKEIGLSRQKIKTAITSSAIFSIVPSIPIVIGVGVMMPFLGLAIPWIRLTVIGALQYEIMAMQQAVGDAAAGEMTSQMVATALVIMTISIISGPLFNIFVYRKYKNKLEDLQKNNKKLLDTITGSLLGGLLAGLASYIIGGAIFANRISAGDGVTSVANGYVTLLTLAISAAIMILCGVLMKAFKWKWLENYALPLTMLGAMASAYGLALVF